MDKIDIEVYETKNKRRPFEIWLKRIKEIHTRAKILTRLDRLRLGNFGDCKVLQNGIYELRIHYGPGIRIYYAKIKHKVVLLLCGGNKGSQFKDIERAKKLFKGLSFKGVNDA